MATAAELQRKDRIFIGGEWVEPQGEETIEVVNSTTEEVMATIPACTPEDADLAVSYPEQPGLGVVGRRREDCIAQEEQQLVSQRRALRVVFLVDAPCGLRARACRSGGEAGAPGGLGMASQDRHVGLSLFELKKMVPGWCGFLAGGTSRGEQIPHR